MSLYAKINSDNIVENVIICQDSQISTIEGFFVKVTEDTKDASVGFSWDKENNKFLKPKPFESWSLDENFEWISPAGDSFLVGHSWDEESQEWVQVISTEE